MKVGFPIQLCYVQTSKHMYQQTVGEVSVWGQKEKGQPIQNYCYELCNQKMIQRNGKVITQCHCHSHSPLILVFLRFIL
ncbi:hypothetical protein RIF29_16621 [Crotalaria pallida]|uniref:Uncharacterized protein n=1 Tax=Crotalaria pallida TaxID=3830 RepID=A0AAN9FFG0_CROPI